jgi:hypothetical protein
MLKKVLKYFLVGENKLILSLIVLGSVTWSLTMVRSGLCFPRDCSLGIGFWGANGHDGIWHLSLINRLSEFKFSLPILSGARMANYHLGYDFLLALIHKITSISASYLYFQFFPPILALLIGFLIYKVTYIWKKSFWVSFWSLFLVYFGGNFAYLVSLSRGQGISGESMFWTQPTIYTLINPPFALSLVVLLLGIFNLDKYYRLGKVKYLVFSSLLFGSLIQVKAYAAVLVLISLFIISLWEIFFDKRKRIMKVFILSFLLTFLISLPLLRSKSLFKPALFWTVETMFAFPDRVYWPRMYQAMINYKASLNLLKGIPAYVFSLLVFVIGNLGIRFIFLLDFKGWKKFFKKPDWLTIFFFSFFSIGFIIPNLVVQEGTPWNTIQFSYYSVFFASFLAADSLSKLKVNKYVVMLFVLFLAMPTTFSSLKHYLASKPQSLLPKEELAALNFLKSKDNGIVLFAFVYNPDIKKPDAPVPLYLYDSTAYISAFSGKDVYLEDTVNLNILGYGKEVKEREEKLKIFLSNPNTQEGRKFLKSNDIKYIYRPKLIYYPGLDEKLLDLANIFDNERVTIYQVN